MSREAREALRRYLEQRKELGESELVLDGMSVDEVMSVLGARGAAADRPAPPPAPAPAPPHTPPAAAPEPPAIDEAAAAAGDWRATLRAADVPPRAAEQPNEGMAPSPAPGAAATPTGVPEAAPTPVARPDASRWRIDGVDAPTGIVVGESMAGLFGGPMDHLATLDDIAQTVAGCTRCPLYRTAKNPVPGQGNPNADLVVVGEAPGGDEDASGLAFVGAAGQLLTKILAAISLSREDVFICNVLKHRPPGNRNPEENEVEACSPYLVRQLELIRPKVILTVGNFAAQTLLGTKLGITKLRGQVHRYHGIPLVATYHPAALLRNEAWKRPTWEDVKLARRILDRAQQPPG
ncbi:phage SPO1 DNA polymerase-related protein [Gemmatirosa kalamazoonensis]|uniref:Type-4 uracil-DNA glycosylase n=1 Tax=Gemmatirosa kalamazoonensis TaxID=861299 RepID=W0RKK8_9BACT|nr:uracil-DNA glycosylase [Gemmatirosa kalamazoonensis]AHG90855.1 phage SPO1 DNA polymerase-related protein [Gemmatirosa kalamazoonensis]